LHEQLVRARHDLERGIDAAGRLAIDVHPRVARADLLGLRISLDRDRSFQRIVITRFS
jgi:hypothetical protein